MTTVGVLTGGGDCPGLNAVIRAVVRTGARHGFDTIGIRDGWRGLIVGDVEPLTDYSVTGILPKTIDNDVAATDYTFGFDTAVSIVTEAIDRLHTTAESHHRIMVVEVMGRHAGWIATVAGIAGGADQILIPEVPFDIDEVVGHLRARY
ncbi:6-phosphofructokinase, partial [Candidatus Skiveiella danica]|uniref:6-phosphofructokinase n=1 Tax=Candidatus Skiveiella danica TaxID=3386177 RepID=UPI0039B8FBBF